MKTIQRILVIVFVLLTLIGGAAQTLAAITVSPIGPGDVLPLQDRSTAWGILQAALGAPHSETLTNGAHFWASWQTAGTRAFAFVTTDAAGLIKSWGGNITNPCDATCVKGLLLAAGWKIAQPAQLAAVVASEMIAVISVKSSLTTIWFLPGALLEINIFPEVGA